MTEAIFNAAAGKRSVAVAGQRFRYSRAKAADNIVFFQSHSSAAAGCHIQNQIGIQWFYSMYIGYRLGGFFGLAFVPIAVLSILHLQELGYLNLWQDQSPSAGLSKGANDPHEL